MSTNSLIARRKSCNLNFSTVQKMIHKLLTQERIKTELDEGRVSSRHRLYDDKLEVKIRVYTKGELAKKLGISFKELERLKSSSFYRGIASKISLPLIRLYCATKFVDGEYKGK